MDNNGNDDALCTADLLKLVEFCTDLDVFAYKDNDFAEVSGLAMGYRIHEAYTTGFIYH